MDEWNLNITQLKRKMEHKNGGLVRMVFALQIGYIYYIIYICFGFHVDFQGSICYVPSG